MNQRAKTIREINQNRSRYIRGNTPTRLLQSMPKKAAKQNKDTTNIAIIFALSLHPIPERGNVKTAHLCFHQITSYTLTSENTDKTH